MRARLFFVVVLVPLLLPARAHASGHWYSVAATPSGHGGLSTLWGGSVSGERAFRNKDRKTWFVDLGVHAGSHETSSLTQYSAMGGLRYAFPRLYRVDEHTVDPHNWYALDWFVHPLVGGVWTREGTNSYQGDFALGFGGGADYLFSPSGGLRLQVDYVWLFREAGGEDFVRISVGVVYRFEKH